MGGEVRRKKLLARQVLTDFPDCCYCGQNSRSETLDHVPPLILFVDKHRPKGLEAPSCELCNQGSRLDDQIVALISRSYPDPQNDRERSDNLKVMRAVWNNNPQIIDQMYGRPVRTYGAKIDSIDEEITVVDCSSPDLQSTMLRFAGRLGYALHWYHTGQIVPAEGGALVRWFTNANMLEQALPYDILEIVGPQNTLRQGSWSVEDQFSYHYALSDTKRMGAYYAYFRKSFATLSWIAFDRADFGKHREPAILSPGFIRRREPQPQTLSTSL